MATDHELELYVMTGCPYCLKVKHFLADNGVTIPERNISTDSDAEQTLIAVGGKRQVPACSSTANHSTNRATSSRGCRKTCSSTHALSVQGPNPYDPNMYTSIQSRHFSTSLDAGVQLFGSHGRSWPANCLRRPLDYGCLTPLERFPRGLWSKKGKYEYCYLFSSSDFDHFRNYSTFHSSADDVISPHMFNKSSS